MSGQSTRAGEATVLLSIQEPCSVEFLRRSLAPSRDVQVHNWMIEGWNISAKHRKMFCTLRLPVAYGIPVDCVAQRHGNQGVDFAILVVPTQEEVANKTFSFPECIVVYQDVDTEWDMEVPSDRDRVKKIERRAADFEHSETYVIVIDRVVRAKYGEHFAVKQTGSLKLSEITRTLQTVSVTALIEKKRFVFNRPALGGQWQVECSSEE